MEKNEEIREMTLEELAEYINDQDDDKIISIKITDIQEGGGHAGRKDI